MKVPTVGASDELGSGRGSLPGSDEATSGFKVTCKTMNTQGGPAIHLRCLSQ